MAWAKSRAWVKWWVSFKAFTVCRGGTCSTELIYNLFKEFTARRGGWDKLEEKDWHIYTTRVHQGCILSPCLCNLYAEYIIRNAWLDESQARIKIARRNINNLRYADDTTLKAESKAELKSLLIKVKEESEKAGLKLSIQKAKIMASSPITSWQIDGKKWKQWQTGEELNGGGIGRGDHFLPYKLIERTVERWANVTKQHLIASRGHQTSRKAAHCLRREVGQNIKENSDRFYLGGLQNHCRWWLQPGN